VAVSLAKSVLDLGDVAFELNGEKSSRFAGNCFIILGLTSSESMPGEIFSRDFPFSSVWMRYCSLLIQSCCSMFANIVLLLVKMIYSASSINDAEPPEHLLISPRNINFWSKCIDARRMPLLVCNLEPE
jgi:hypothetical protein